MKNTLLIFIVIFLAVNFKLQAQTLVDSFVF